MTETQKQKAISQNQCQESVEMNNQVITKTRVGNATITVIGMYAKDTSTTLKDIQKSLIQRHIIGNYGVDLSAIQSEHVVTQAKEVTV